MLFGSSAVRQFGPVSVLCGKFTGNSSPVALARRMKTLSQTDFEDQFFMDMGESAMHSIAGRETRAPVDTAELWNYASYEAIL